MSKFKVHDLVYLKQPCTLIGDHVDGEYLGERHGEHWFLVESKTGRTGVPRSQLKNIDWREKSENSC